MPYSRVIFSLLAAVLLAASCGDPTGAIVPDDHSLGWGRALANAVRDSEFPAGVLFMVSCIDVNNDGDPETAIPWQFHYAEASDSTNILIVMVQYTGTTNHIWEDSTSVPLGKLPDYTDAGPWVSAARDSLGSGYSDWEEYALVVKGNEYPEFPVALNVAVLQFMSPDSTEHLSVILDSDKNNVLGIIQY